MNFLLALTSNIKTRNCRR